MDVRRLRTMPFGRIDTASRTEKIPMRANLPALAVAALVLPLAATRAEVPEAIAAPGQPVAATVHAEGAQVYECKGDAAGKLTWQFRSEEHTSELQSLRH